VTRHGGDIITDTRLLSSPTDESDENMEALCAAFLEHYGMGLKAASENIATGLSRTLSKSVMCSQT